MPTPTKFKIGDKVRLGRGIPKYILAEIPRRRSRTIKSMGYDATAQHCLYEIGERGNMPFAYLFRPSQLTPANGKTHIIGRPRQKLLTSHSSQNLTALTNKERSNTYDKPAKPI